MNYLDSECSSGCESGWTVYLEQSFLSPNASAGDFHGKTTGKFCNGTIRRNEKEDNGEEDDGVKEEEEEDLSMVSDASSGPPHNFHEDNEILLHLNHNNGEDYKCSKSGGEKRQKMKEQQQGFASFRPHREQPSFLDDTASSPLFNFSNNNMQQDFAMTNDKQGSLESAVLDYSQGFSATHFQGRPAFQDPFGSFLHSSPLSGNQLQETSDLKGIRK